MGRPRKNRVGEYASALSEEFSYQLQRELEKSMEVAHQAYREELNELRGEIRQLSRDVENMAKKSKPGRAKVGKWVPGGPGRPPKDAEDRIAAFESRTERGKTKNAPKRRGKKSDEAR